MPKIVVLLLLLYVENSLGCGGSSVRPSLPRMSCEQGAPCCSQKPACPDARLMEVVGGLMHIGCAGNRHAPGLIHAFLQASKEAVVANVRGAACYAMLGTAQDLHRLIGAVVNDGQGAKAFRLMNDEDEWILGELAKRDLSSCERVRAKPDLLEEPASSSGSVPAP